MTENNETTDTSGRLFRDADDTDERLALDDDATGHVHMRDADDTEGHAQRFARDDDDTEGHVQRSIRDDDDTEGHVQR
jgi:hypothetical protein